MIYRRRRRLKGIHSRPDTNRTGAEGLSFYYPRLLHCLDQMLAVMLLSQHRVSSSKTVRPRAPCGARCMGHIVSTWSAVCSEAPHSQFGEGARPQFGEGVCVHIKKAIGKINVVGVFSTNCKFNRTCGGQYRYRMVFGETSFLQTSLTWWHRKQIQLRGGGFCRTGVY